MGWKRVHIGFLCLTAHYHFVEVPSELGSNCLTFGPLDQNGAARVALAYDHRLMDGALVAEILQPLETTLTDVLRSEFLSIPAPQ